MGNHDRDHDIKYWEDLGFEKVYDKPILLDNFYILSHEPLYIPYTVFVNIYGHVHNNENYNCVSRVGACVCVERRSYAPVSLQNIKILIEEEREKVVNGRNIIKRS